MRACVRVRVRVCACVRVRVCVRHLRNTGNGNGCKKVLKGITPSVVLRAHSREQMRLGSTRPKLFGCTLDEDLMSQQVGIHCHCLFLVVTFDAAYVRRLFGV